MIEVFNEKPEGFLQLYWLGDLNKYGITTHQIYNPFTNHLGLGFIKNGKRKYIIVPNAYTESEEQEFYLQIWKIEESFGVPKEESLYYKELKVKN